MAGIISFITTFLIGFAAISLVLMLHEIGHFIAARALHVEVEEFVFGFGPRLFTFHGRRTDFSIALIPLGGCTRMKGSEDLTKALRDQARTFERGEKGSYFTSKPLVRFIIFLSGPLINIIFSIFVFTAISFIPVETISDTAAVVNASEYPALFSTSVTQDGVMKGDIIISLDSEIISSFEEAEAYLAANIGRSVHAVLSRNGELIETDLVPSDGLFGLTLFQKPVIGRVTNDSPFRPEDIVLSVNGAETECTLDVYSIPKGEQTFIVERDGRTVEITITPDAVYPFAWKSDTVMSKAPSLKGAVLGGVTRTFTSLMNVVSTIKGIITGAIKDTRNEVTGPTRAASQIGSITALSFQTSSNTGWRAFLYLMSTVSVSIAAVNLLPVPSFDGGQLLINLYQMIFRRELRPKTYIYFHIAGTVLSVLLLIMLYYVDIKYFLSN